MTTLKLVGRDKGPEPERSIVSREVPVVPNSYCIHRSIRALVPSPIDGTPQAIETPMACRRDCMHYVPDLADPENGRGACNRR